MLVLWEWTGCKNGVERVVAHSDDRLKETRRRPLPSSARCVRHETSALCGCASPTDCPSRYGLLSSSAGTSSLLRVASRV